MDAPQKARDHNDLKTLCSPKWLSHVLFSTIVMLCCITKLHAQTLDLEALNTQIKPISLNSYFEFWIDESAESDLQAAISRADGIFQPLADSAPLVIDHNHGTLWLKLHLSETSNETMRNWQIVFMDDRIESLTAFQLNRSGILAETRLGRMRPGAQLADTAAGLPIKLVASAEPSLLIIAVESQVPAYISPVAIQTDRLLRHETLRWLFAAFFPSSIFMTWLCYIGLSRVRQRTIPGVLWTLGPILAAYCWINTPLSHNFRMLGSGWTWQIALTTTPLLIGLVFLSLVKNGIDSKVDTGREDQILAYTPLVFLIAIVANLALAPANSLWLGWSLLLSITIWSIMLLQHRASQKVSAKLLIMGLSCWLPLSFLEVGLASGFSWTYWPKNFLQGPLILLSEILIFFQIEWVSLQQDERTNKRLRQQRRNLSQTLKSLQISLEVKNRYFQKISRDLGIQIRALSALDQHQDLPDYCHKGLEQLRSLARDIQRFCEIEAGCLTLTHRPFDFKALIESLTYTHTRLARHKGLTFTCSQCSEVPGTLIGDPEVIAQLLSQLLDNAIRYTNKGEITLKFQVANPKGDRKTDDDMMVMITIADSGPGIPEHLQKQFYGINDADTSATPSRESQLGVGLTTCRHMVELMQGEIHITSLPGNGTTCYVSIPLKADTLRNSQVAHKRVARPQAIKTSSVLGKAGLKVALLTSDNSKLLDEIQPWLNDLGYKVLCAKNTESTIDLATQNAVDLFICISPLEKVSNPETVPEQFEDMLPETITRIRQMAAYPKTPIIAVLPQGASQQHSQACLRNGATQALSHPLTDATLRSMLDAGEQASMVKSSGT